MHVFYLDLEQYPLTRSRRIYEGASVSGEGGNQADWNVMSEDWGYQHGLEPWQMPDSVHKSVLSKGSEPCRQRYH